MSTTNHRAIHIKQDIANYTKFLLTLHDQNESHTATALIKTLGMDPTFAHEYATRVKKYKNPNDLIRWQFISYYHYYLKWGVLKTAKAMEIAPNTVQKYKTEVDEKYYVLTYEDKEHFLPLIPRWIELKQSIHALGYGFLHDK